VLAIILPVSTTPAGASTGARVAAPAVGVQPAITPADILRIIKAARDAYNAWKSFTGGGSSAQDTTAQILAAINAARDDIIRHIDSIATATASACARSAIIDFVDFNAFTPDNQQAFARDATSCVTLIDGLLGAVTDKAAINELGFAVNAVGPIALAARARTGLSTGSVTPILAADNRSVINKINPSCHQIHLAEGGGDFICFAYNGDTGIGWPIRGAQDEAMGRTSWMVAQAALPLLV
jgi:hypothetical protein